MWLFICCCLRFDLHLILILFTQNLLETQFDCNSKFKEKINEVGSVDLRVQPLGRDKDGLAYWILLDNEFNVRIYREEQDDEDAESWEMVVRWDVKH